jgi:hypothetical protein
LLEPIYTGRIAGVTGPAHVSDTVAGVIEEDTEEDLVPV